MRCLLMAASALALIIGFGPAAVSSPIGKTVDREGVQLKVRSGERGTDAGKGTGNESGRDGVRGGDRSRDKQFRPGDRDGDGRRHGNRGVDFDIYGGPAYSYGYGPAEDHGYDADADPTRAPELRSDFDQCGRYSYWDGNACQLGRRP